MSTAFTSDSSVSGAAVTPSCASSFSAAAPQGTDGSQSAIRRSAFGEVVEARDAGRVAGRNRELERVRGEHHRIHGEARVGHGLHGRLGGRGEDVDGGALDDLLRERGAAAVAEHDVDVRMLRLELLRRACRTPR